RSLLALTATPPPILSSLSLHDALPIYLWIAFALALLGTGASFAPAIQGKPFFGYAAALLFIAASAFAIPALVSGLMAASSTLLRRFAGVEAFLASRSLAGSLRRTSLLVAA